MPQPPPDRSLSPAPIGIIACAVLEDEIRHYSKDRDHVLDVRWLEQGLHNDPPRLAVELQNAVDALEQDERIHAILLGYGLCSRGSENVTTRRCQLVVPRAHDCITILLGSKERYSSYISRFPGTYWYSPGWNRCHIPPGKERYEKRRTEYIEKFGEDNADYLMEMEQHWFTTYDRATYVDLGVGVTEADLQYTRDCADWLNWRFDRQQGDPGLLIDMLDGNWDDDRFLVLEPGQSLTPTADERVIQAVTIEGRPASDTK